MADGILIWKGMEGLEGASTLLQRIEETAGTHALRLQRVPGAKVLEPALRQTGIAPAFVIGCLGDAAAAIELMGLMALLHDVPIYLVIGPECRTIERSIQSAIRPRVVLYEYEAEGVAEVVAVIAKKFGPLAQLSSQSF